MAHTRNTSYYPRSMACKACQQCPSGVRLPSSPPSRHTVSEQCSGVTTAVMTRSPLKAVEGTTPHYKQRSFGCEWLCAVYRSVFESHGLTLQDTTLQLDSQPVCHLPGEHTTAATTFQAKCICLLASWPVDQVDVAFRFWAGLSSSLRCCCRR